MSPIDPVVIASYARTPMGGFQGELSPLKATELGAAAVQAAVERAAVDPAAIERIFMGCVLPAGLGQAPARQAALGAGLPMSVGYFPERRMERRLIGDYEALILGLAETVTDRTMPIAVEIAAAAALIRGYGPVKDAGLEAYRERLEELMAKYRAPEIVRMPEHELATVA